MGFLLVWIMATYCYTNPRHFLERSLTLRARRFSWEEPRQTGSIFGLVFSGAYHDSWSPISFASDIPYFPYLRRYFRVNVNKQNSKMWSVDQDTFLALVATSNPPWTSIQLRCKNQLAVCASLTIRAASNVKFTEPYRDAWSIGWSSLIICCGHVIRPERLAWKDRQMPSGTCQIEALRRVKFTVINAESLLWKYLLFCTPAQLTPPRFWMRPRRSVMDKYSCGHR